MTNPRVDSGNPVGGTQPLARSASQLLPLPQATPAQARPKAQADANSASGRTFGLPAQDPALEVKRQALAEKKARITELQLEMNSAQAEMAKKKAEAEKQPLWKRALNGVVDFVSDGLQAVWNKAKEEVSDLTDQISKLEQELEEAVQKGAEIVGAGIQEYRESRAEGQGLLDSLKDAASASGQKVVTDVIDPTLDKSVLGEDNAFNDKGAGAMGPILTNRLSIGESVSLKIEAGATIPLEEFGIPNAKIDGGGTLKVTRAQKTDAKGNLVTEPKDANGNPPTELRVTMELEGKAGASYSARVGFDATVKAAGYEAGVKATAGAEAEGGLHGRVAFTFAFDPNDGKDMGVLTGMMKMAGTAGAEAAIPGIGPVLAGKTVLENRELIAEFGRHLYAVDGEGGLYAQATASASAQAGIFKGDRPGSDSQPLAAQSLGQKARQAGKDYLKGKLDAAEESGLENLQLQIGSLSGALGGSASVGGKLNYRTKERTLTVKLDGKAEASGSVLAYGKGGGIGGNRTVELTYNPDGSLKGVKLQEAMSKEKFEGIRTTVEDIFGHPIDNGVIAQVSESDTVKVSYDLKPEEVAKVAEQMRKLGPAAGIGYATTRRIDKDTVMLNERSVTATKRTAAEFKVGFNLSLGAEVGVRAGVTLAHEIETALTS